MHLINTTYYYYYQFYHKLTTAINTDIVVRPRTTPCSAPPYRAPVMADLAADVGRALRDRGATLCTVEATSGGLIAAELMSKPRACFSLLFLYSQFLICLIICVRMVQPVPRLAFLPASVGWLELSLVVASSVVSTWQYITYG